MPGSSPDSGLPILLLLLVRDMSKAEFTTNRFRCDLACHRGGISRYEARSRARIAFKEKEALASGESSERVGNCHFACEFQD